MRRYRSVVYFSVCALIVLISSSSGAKSNAPQFPQNVGFTTLQDGNSGNSLLLPFPIEGLTGDEDGNLYTTGRAFAHSDNGANPNPADPTPCPVWRIEIAAGSLAASFSQIGSIPNPTNHATTATASCGPSGITFDSAKNIYVADSQQGGVIWKLTRQNNGTYVSPASITDAFAVGVPGTNGIAFDRNGNLWTGDGVTGKGRVWKIPPTGATCTPVPTCALAELFRIQPMRNGTDFDGDVAAQTGVTSQGVGRQARDFPPGTLTIPTGTTLPTTPAGGQDLVANGVAFDHEGNLFVIDTARGALWKVQFDKAGSVSSRMGCDTTFTDNTLCLSNILAAHPILEGGDGIALDVAGNVWVDANERNAVAVVTKSGDVTEIFRSPVNATTKLRNAAADAAGNKHILEFPTSPFLSGTRLCTSQSDGNRRDNSPSAAGEINASAALAAADPGKRAKISCMTDDSGNLIQLNIPGMPLPVH